MNPGFRVNLSLCGANWPPGVGGGCAGAQGSAAASPGCSGAPSCSPAPAGRRRARFVWKNEAGFCVWSGGGGEAAGAEAATHHASFSTPSTFAKGRLK